VAARLAWARLSCVAQIAAYWGMDFNAPAACRRARLVATSPPALAGIAALLAALAFGLLPPAPAAAQQRTFTLTAAALTREAALRFPQKRCLLGFACMTLSDPRIRLKNDDPRIFLEAQAIPDFGTRPLGEGVIEVAGMPRYDPALGAFFVDAPEILRLDFADLPPAYAAPAVDLARSLLVDYLRQTPVWVLDEKDSQQALTKLVLRKVEVRAGRLHLVVGDDD
jgi:hypothetical protein